MVDLIKVATPSIGEVRDSGRDPWDDLQLLYKIFIGSLEPDIKQVAAQSPDQNTHSDWVGGWSASISLHQCSF
jgi:hypothetical protein